MATQLQNDPAFGLTPGGSRPVSTIHRLESAEVVATAGGVGRIVQQAVPSNTPAPASTEGLVLTPGGYRHPSLVHRLERRDGLTRSGNVLRRFDLGTRESLDLPPIRREGPPRPALGSGWITDATFTNTSGSPYYYFSTVWTVPPAPATDSGQTIFLFNALLDSAQNDILQPVLQWGPSQAGGGSYWCVACWFIDSSGNAFYHDPVRVNEGDTLLGVMALTGQSGGNFSYNCFFQGIDGTQLLINDISELVVATETLECYSIQQCSDYPNTGFTTMGGIDVKLIGAGTAAAVGSGLDGYRGTDDSQHVNFVDAIGHVHELFIRPGVGWVNNDLTVFTNGAPAAAGTALDGYWGSDNSQHVNFVDANGHVHELYIHPGASWVDNDLTAFTNGTPAAAGSALDGYWGSDNSQHINFIDANGHVHELYIPAGGGWVDNDLTAFTNGMPAAPGSALDGYWGGDSSQHVNFIDANGHVHELYIAPGGAWVDNDLTVFSNGTPAAAGSALDGYWGSDSSQHVNFIDANGHVHELYIAPGGAWVDNDLTTFANGTPAAAGSALDGYWGSDDSQHVNFIDANGHVHELYIHPGAGWVDNDLTAFGGADLTVAWTVENRVTDCGQHTLIVNEASPSGAVALWYRPTPAWQTFPLAPAESAAPDARIAAVSRIPGSMELWWIGGDGSVQGAYWYDGGSWQRYELAPAGSASTTGGIHAVSRIATSMEVWWIGPDGSVQDAYWYEGATWQRFTLAGPGSASVASGIRAVSRIPGSMELWWVAPDGSVQDAYWYDGGTWQQFELAGPNSAATNSAIAAVSRIPGSMELWWAGPDGSVQDAYWYDGATWARFQLAGPGSAAPGSGMAAVSRIPGSMELWWITPDGSVQDAFWYDGATWQQFQLAGPNSASTGSAIAAVSRIPGSMELWWAAPDGSLRDAYWYDGGQWQQFQFAGPNSASPGAGIAAVSRIPGSMEIWWVDAAGGIDDGYWYG